MVLHKGWVRKVTTAEANDLIESNFLFFSMVDDGQGMVAILPFEGRSSLGLNEENTKQKK